MQDIVAMGPIVQTILGKPRARTWISASSADQIRTKTIRRNQPYQSRELNHDLLHSELDLALIEPVLRVSQNLQTEGPRTRRTANRPISSRLRRDVAGPERARCGQDAPLPSVAKCDSTRYGKPAFSYQSSAFIRKQKVRNGKADQLTSVP